MVAALLWCRVRRVVVRGDGCVLLCAVVVPWLLRGRVVVSWLFVVSYCDRGWLLLGRGDLAVAAVICLVVVECWVVGRKEVGCGDLL